MKPVAVGVIVAITVYALKKDWKVTLIVTIVHMLAHFEIPPDFNIKRPKIINKRPMY